MRAEPLLWRVMDAEFHQLRKLRQPDPVTHTPARRHSTRVRRVIAQCECDCLLRAHPAFLGAALYRRQPFFAPDTPDSLPGWRRQRIVEGSIRTQLEPLQTALGYLEAAAIGTDARHDEIPAADQVASTARCVISDRDFSEAYRTGHLTKVIQHDPEYSDSASTVKPRMRLRDDSR